MANVTVSAVDVTITTETFGGAALPSWKMLGAFTKNGGTSYDVSFAGLNSTTFTDWYTADSAGESYDSYLETGFELAEDAKQDKQPIYVHSYCAKTSKTQTPGGFYETPTNVGNLFGDIWSELADGNRRRYHAMATWNGDIYIQGGYTTASGLSSTLRKYTVATDTWSELTGIGSPSYGIRPGVVIGDYWYLFAGIASVFEPLSIMKRYNFLTDTWSTLATGLDDPKDKLYAYATDGANYIYYHASSNPSKGLVRYNIDTDNFTTLTRIPSSPSDYAYGEGVVTGGKIYWLGNNSQSARWMIYDIAGNSWDTSNLITGYSSTHRFDKQQMRINGTDIYTWSGGNGSGGYNDELWKITAGAVSPTQLTSSTSKGRIESAMTFLGDDLYIQGGYDGTHSTGLQDLIKYKL